MTKRCLNILVGIVLGVLLKYDLSIFSLILTLIVELVLLILTKKYFIWSIIFLLCFYLIANFQPNDLDTQFNGNVLVKEVHNGYYIVSNNFNKFIIYSDESFNQYSTVYIKGYIKLLETNKSLNVSSFNDYLYTQGINYVLNINSYEIINKGDIVRPFLQNLLLKDLSDESQEFVKLLVLGIKDNSDFYNNLKSLGVVHLFVISGFHLNILYSFLKKIFKRLNDKILVFLLLPYLYLLNFSIPVLRAFIFLLIKSYKKNKEFNSLRCLLLIAIMFLFYDYHLLFNLSFELTFITNLIIILLQNVSENSILFKNIIKPILIQLSTLPLVLNINYEFNILSLINTIVLSFTIEYLIGICLLTSLFKITDPLLKIIANIYTSIINKMASLKTTLIFGKMNQYLILVFYGLLILLLFLIFIKRIKSVLLTSFFMIVILGIQYFKNDLFGQNETIFINVGQGDSTLIIGKNNAYNVLIDTGGSNDYDVASSRIIPLLKSKGIKKLDMVILTHGDLDHDGALESLLENYHVDDYTYAQNFYSLNINGLEIVNYNHYYNNNSEENDKSGVLFFKNGERNFLIMGDASNNIEKKIIEDYKFDIDVLKVGHHGSKTSSSDNFIKTIKPNFAIISVGYNNYGHPHNIVIETLKNNNVILYRTDISYSVCFKDDNIIEKY